MTMFVMDMPDVPQQYAQVMLVQASQGQGDRVETDRTIGVCSLVENPVQVQGRGYSAINSITPISGTQVYFQNVEHREILGPGVVTVLQNPGRGTLEPVAGERGIYWYLPKSDLLGPDRATFLVEMSGKKMRVEYFFRVLKGVADDDYQDKQLCPKGLVWKISVTPTIRTPTYSRLNTTSIDERPLVPGVPDGT